MNTHDAVLFAAYLDFSRRPVAPSRPSRFGARLHRFSPAAPEADLAGSAAHEPTPTAEPAPFSGGAA